MSGFGATKEVLRNSTSICTTAPWSRQLCRVSELGCLAGFFIELLEFRSGAMPNRPLVSHLSKFDQVKFGQMKKQHFDPSIMDSK